MYKYNWNETQNYAIMHSCFYRYQMHKFPLENIAAIDFLLIKYYIEFNIMWLYKYMIYITKHIDLFSHSFLGEHNKFGSNWIFFFLDILHP